MLTYARDCVNSWNARDGLSERCLFARLHVPVLLAALPRNFDQHTSCAHTRSAYHTRKHFRLRCAERGVLSARFLSTLQTKNQPQHGFGGATGSFREEALFQGDDPRHVHDGPLGQARTAFWQIDISGRRGQLQIGSDGRANRGPDSAAIEVVGLNHQNWTRKVGSDPAGSGISPHQISPHFTPRYSLGRERICSSCKPSSSDDAESMPPYTSFNLSVTLWLECRATNSFMAVQ